MEEKQPSLENWDDFQGKYFKAISVKSWPATATVVKVDSRTNEENLPQLILELEYNKKKFLFEPNIGNTGILKQHCPENPKQLIGKNLTFEKVRNRNPKTQLFVDSLEISGVA